MKFYSDTNDKFFEKNENQKTTSVRIQKYNNALAINALIEMTTKKNFDDYDNLTQRYLLGLTDPYYNRGYTAGLQKAIQGIYEYLKKDLDNNYEKLKKSPLYTNFILPLSAAMPWEEFAANYNRKEIMADCINAYFDHDSTCEIGIDMVEVLKSNFDGKSLKAFKDFPQKEITSMQEAALRFRKKLQENYTQIMKNKDIYDEK